MISPRRCRWTSTFALLAALILTGGLAACGGSDENPATAVTAPKLAEGEPEYTTYSQHFLALKQAAQAANYHRFAAHLAPDAPTALVQRLDVSFSKAPFELFTRKTVTTDTSHRRMIELRGARSRLYVVVRLERVSGGWKVAGFEIDRDPNVLLALL